MVGRPCRFRPLPCDVLSRAGPTPTWRAASRNMMETGAMRFMIIVRANPDTESGVPPAEPLVEAMAAYHGQLAKAGVLLDANGLQPSARGFRLRWHGGPSPPCGRALP